MSLSSSSLRNIYFLCYKIYNLSNAVLACKLNACPKIDFSSVSIKSCKTNWFFRYFPEKLISFFIYLKKNFFLFILNLENFFFLEILKKKYKSAWKEFQWFFFSFLFSLFCSWVKTLNCQVHQLIILIRYIGFNNENIFYNIPTIGVRQQMSSSSWYLSDEECDELT